MVTPAFKPLTPSRTLGTSARILRQSQAFRKPFNKKLGVYSGLVFLAAFLALNLLHGNQFGQVSQLSYDTYNSAYNFWHHAFIGEGPAGAKVDTVNNPIQFVLYLIAAIVNLPLGILLVIQALTIPFLMGYTFAKLLADRARNWVLGLAGLVSVVIFLNGDFTYAVNTGDYMAWAGLIFEALVVEFALDIRRQVVRSNLYVLVALAGVALPIGLVLVIPILYFYYVKVPKGIFQKPLNLIMIYGIGIPFAFLLVRMVYFGTLGFFDPIINFQWQLSVHGFSYLVAGVTQALFQLGDAGGIVCVVLLILALFVERQQSLGMMGLVVFSAMMLMFFAAVILPMPTGRISVFTWLTPLLMMVPAYFVMNPLPQFVKSWNTRLFITALAVVMIAASTWSTKAVNLSRNTELSDPFGVAVKQLGVKMPVAYGVLPSFSPYKLITWASNSKQERLLRSSAGLYLDWFFEVVAPDILTLDLQDKQHLMIRQDARFDGYYSLYKKGNATVPDLYVRTEMLNKGEEYQLLKRLEHALTESQDQRKELPRLALQEKRRLEMQGGIYRLQPLVRCLTKLAVELEWIDCLEEIGNIVAETEGGSLNKMLVTASYTARFDAEIQTELTRFYFVSNFMQGNVTQTQLMMSSPDPVAALPNSPGFQDGKIKVYLNRNSMVVYLPNASKVDTMSPFFFRINQFVGTNHNGKSYFNLPAFRISDRLNLLGPSDGYASFAIPGLSNISTIDIGQRAADKSVLWTTTFSVNHVRKRDSF